VKSWRSKHVCDEHAMVHLTVNDIPCIHINGKSRDVSSSMALSCFGCIVYAQLLARLEAAAGAGANVPVIAP